MSARARLLIVDDSRIFRSALADALAGADEVEVVGSVWNGAKALDFVRATPPDLVTLDVEMPGMNGLEVLREVQRFNASRPAEPAVGVLMVSAFTRRGADITIQALEAGAFDFLPKPAGANAAANLETLRQELLAKVRLFMARRGRGAGRRAPAVPQGARKPDPPSGTLRRLLPLPRPLRAVLIAVSTGGPPALAELLPDLCARISLPVFVVQHMPPDFTASLARSLNARCTHQVVEAVDGAEVQPRTVYFAPGGKHLVVRLGTRGRVLTGLNEQPPENSFRPSADVLFRSAAAVYGGDVVALVLTGMGNDGTAGLAVLRRAGALVLAQDEATSVVWGMPGSAVAAGHVDAVLPLPRLAAAVEALIAP